MSIYNVHAGHNYYAPGANGYFSETEQDRVVKNKVISLLRAEGHTVYDCTDENGRTQNANLANIVSLQNSHNVDLDISIHFNAFNWSANGVEVLQYSKGTQAVAQRIVNNIAALGFYNRGVKNGSSLYVLRKSNCPAILIECCFCDSKTDSNIYNADKIAQAIVKGILNKSSLSNSGSSSSNASSSSGSTSTDKLYRVRKSWNDIKSQIGAYKSLDNAKAACPDGYSVFDWNGKAVYSKGSTTQDELYRVRKSWSDAKSQIGAYKILDNAKAACIAGYSVFDSKGKVVYSVPEKNNSATNDNLYRVRKSWDDEKSQIGAYKILDNAKAACTTGYHVFDWNGKVVYSPVIESEDNVSDDTNIEDTEIKTLNNLASMSTDEFIQYIGNIASKDKNKILPSITIAQAILESGWGKSELAQKANNLFGMKKSLSGDNWGSEWGGKIYAKTTNEEVDGKVIQIYADFRAYDSVEESIKDHNKYLAYAKNGSSLRYNGIVGETDYTKVAKLLVSGGYATDSKYANKLCDLIDKYNLDTFDHVADASELETLKDENENLKKENAEMKSVFSTILESLEGIIKMIKNILGK